MTAVDALPDRLEIGRLTFEVVPRSTRRTLEITIDRDASLSIKAPSGVTLDQIERFVDAKQAWIYRKLAEKDAFLGAPIVKQFVSGEGFAYLGRSYRLEIVDDQPVAVSLSRGRFRIRRSAVDSGFAAMTAWYRRSGQAWLRNRIRPWERRMGVDGLTVGVTELGYRWGSTRGNDRINIHWATLQLRPLLIDYVLVHELAHLFEPNHTQAFWDLVERVMPDYELRKTQLAKVGSSVWIGETHDG